MTRGAVGELAARVAVRYRRARRREKSLILDDFCANTSLHHKAAIRLLARQRRPPRRASGRLGDGWLAPTRLQAGVAVRTWAEWEGVAPGELQGDLVLHCGERTAGRYLATLVTVDAATGWLGLQPLRSLSPQRVRHALHFVEQDLPVPLRALHTDYGSEFINHVVVPWCREQSVRLSRGRSYRKNDQARVEQKNWLAVRRLIGYGRYEGEQAYRLLRELAPLLEPSLSGWCGTLASPRRSPRGSRRSLPPSTRSTSSAVSTSCSHGSPRTLCGAEHQQSLGDRVVRHRSRFGNRYL